ncbi:antA/AntB antirepressor family protein [Francisella marina]|uniref:Phage antirepressor Ant n=1 Tax=Francisella marina TaxID=2249302 RepID=A0ABX5ZGN1_9GAMM|nr:antA/AntB antirepressor family protein [Francisella marina]QEO57601.1 hypothetical protein F0R74_06940 [Francisella marina]QEO58284.1 hypothetical protein F0R75_00300 [Francisella marina]
MNIEISKNKIGSEAINSVNARELYSFLESKQDFSTWIKNRIDKYEFEENIDYIRLHKKMEANNATQIDYIITIDMAKEISMLQRSEKGKQARKYFIECEKQLLSNSLQLPDFTNPAIAARAWADEVEKKQIALNTIEQQKPKVLFADAVSASKSAILVGELAKLIKQNFQKHKDEEFKIIKGYSNYVVSNYGRIISLRYNKQNIIKERIVQKNRNGYIMVDLFDDNKKTRLLSVHRLVAKAFLKKDTNRNCVNHIDGDRGNNHISNLEWCNNSENTKHSYDVTKNQDYSRLSDIGKEAARKLRKFTMDEVYSIRNEYNKSKTSFAKMAIKYNVGKTTMARIIKGVTYAS